MRPSTDVMLPSQQPDNSSEPLIVAGKGWGKVVLSLDRKTVEGLIGEGQERIQFETVYLIGYPSKGIQISYGRRYDTLRNIYFYNGQHDYKSFATFQGRTDRGVDWKASPEDVIKAYGKPEADYEGVYGKPKEPEGVGWRRIVFSGIDFRWESRVMVRIGILQVLECYSITRRRPF